MEISRNRRYFSTLNILLNRNSDTLKQDDCHIRLSADGKTLIRCQRDIKGTVVIPDGVSKIGRGSFEGCTSLTSLVIPDSVTEIEFEALVSCTKLDVILVDPQIRNLICKAELA